MKIMFWVGYSNPIWDKGDWMNSGMGGSEYCVIKLADYLDLKGHDITISGDVKTGNWHGVKYVHHNDLLQHRGPRGVDKNNIEVYEHYDVVIAINYLNVFKHLEDALIDYDKAYFWMHNEDFYKWYRGTTLHEWEQYITHPKLNKIIGVSKYHIDEHLKPKFKALGYTPQQLTTYIHSIDNAIDLNDYKNRSYQGKIKNRIIWSSTPDRGLNLLLDNWVHWKQQVPDLSLEICCPPYGVNWMNRNVDDLEDVNWQGARCPNDLKKEIAKAEYWIYASDYTETYCITALEMMMGRVKLIHNGTGNLGALIGDTRGTMIEGLDADKIIQTIVNDNNDPKPMSDKAAVANTFAMEQNWNTRVDEWIELIK
jgi:hypothetical protein